MAKIRCYKGKEPYIFISYAHRDSASVYPILERMKNNLNPDKHSRAIFAESIAEMCQKNGYHN